jgi:hypothetical protein
LDIGNYVISVSVSNPVCPAITWDTTVNVCIPPALTLDPIPDFCDTAEFVPGVVYELFGLAQPQDYIDSIRWTLVGACIPANQTSTAFDPGILRYCQPGTYTVCVTAYNRCGSATACQTFEVIGGASLNIVTDEDTVATGDTIFIINSNTQILDYLWTVMPTNGVTISDIMSPMPAFVFNGPPGTYTIGADIISPICNSIWQKEVVVQPFVHTGQEYVEPEIRLFPNPSNGNFLVRLSADIKPLQMELYDHLGQMLLRLYPDDIQSEEGYKIKFETKGAYFLRVVLVDQKSIVKNIVVH